MIHIGISGPIAAGKSTLAKDIKELAGSSGLRAEIIPFATGIRELVALESLPYRKNAITIKLFDWGYDTERANNAATMIDTAMWMYPSQPGIKNRRLLQTIGTEVGRQYLGADTWIIRTQQLARKYDALDFVLSDDLRFDNEVYAVDVHIALEAMTDMQELFYDERLAQLDDNYIFSDHPSERSLTRPALLKIPIGFTGIEVSNLFTELDYIRRLRI